MAGSKAKPGETKLLLSKIRMDGRRTPDVDGESEGNT
jgi:hypothetical protein